MVKRVIAVDTEEPPDRTITPHFIREEDGFNEQPGSSSAIGGTRGSQEYGIEGEVAEEEEHAPYRSVSIDREGSGGLSHFSASGIEILIHKSEASEDLIQGEGSVSAADLRTLIQERILGHPLLKERHIELAFDKHGELIVTGVVSSMAERIVLHELVEAIAPGMSFKDLLNVG